jgi:hypothetical protein
LTNGWTLLAAAVAVGFALGSDMGGFSYKL